MAKKLACRLGRHDWTTHVEEGESYKVCAACGKTPREPRQPGPLYQVLLRAAKLGLRPAARSAGLVGSGLAVDRLNGEAQLEMPGLLKSA